MDSLAVAPPAGAPITGETVAAWDISYDDQAACRMPDGVELYYEERGHGPHLTLINNFFLICPVWRALTQQLAQRNRLLTYDLRNQGASSRVGMEHRFSEHADDLLHLLDHLGVEGTYLVGTSISTLIGLDFARAHPDRVKGLVLVGPVFSPYGTLRRKLLAKSWLRSLDNGGAANLFNMIYPLVFGDRTLESGGKPAYLAVRERFLALNSEAQIRVSLTASLSADDSPERLREVASPTLLMVGDADFQWSPSSLAAATALFPRARGEIIPGTGHLPFFEATQAFEQSVQRFVDECESGSFVAGGVA
jgi:pimeloyl-ACP methyl ester carboxylesterase